MSSRLKMFITIVFAFCTAFVILAVTSRPALAAIDKSSINDLRKIADQLQKERKDRFLKLQRRGLYKPVDKPSNKKTTEKVEEKKTSKAHKPQSHNKRQNSKKARPFFDIPVTYNSRVKTWIRYYQNQGQRWYRKRLERSYKYLPTMKWVLKERGLPQDLAYIAMIESGFSPHAESHASAVGYWQFIKPTAERYGLRMKWWIDERRDHIKSTEAAAKYLGDLYRMFNSWYLTAAAYNTGEGRIKRLIKKYNTKNFWKLADKPDFPEETRNYIPKLIAALLIAKAPGLYGFRTIEPMSPPEYNYIYVPGGTDLFNMASFLKIPVKRLKRLNPELTQGFIPGFVKNHRIRIPKGYNRKVAQYIRSNL